MDNMKEDENESSEMSVKLKKESSKMAISDDSDESQTNKKLKTDE
jgi:hypothetical protein